VSKQLVRVGIQTN